MEKIGENEKRKKDDPTRDRKRSLRRRTEKENTRNLLELRKRQKEAREAADVGKKQ